MIPRLRLYARAGAVVGDLTDLVEFGASFEFSDVGALTFTYPADGQHAASLTDFAEVAFLTPSGTEQANGRFVIVGSNKDRVEPGEPVSYTAKSWLWRLEQALVYPAGGASNPAAPRSFTNATPGAIMDTLISEAVARGALSGLTRSFGASTQTGGAAWPETVTLDFEVGVSLLSVLRALADLGLVEARTLGRDLRLWAADGSGTDRTVGATPTILRAGRDLADAPEQRSAERIAGVTLVAGEGGVLHEEVTPAVNAAFGRIEKYVSASGISDTGTLAQIGQQAGLTSSTAARQITSGVILGDPETPVPAQDFMVGDWIYLATPGLERVRVRQITYGVGEEGEPSAGVVLNDRLAEQEIRVARTLEKLLGGTSAASTVGTPGTGTVDGPSEFESDGSAPGVPSTPSLTSRLGTVTVTWNGKDQAGNSMAYDLRHCEVHVSTTSGFTPAAGTLKGVISGGSNFLVVADLPYNVTHYVRLVAVDFGGDKSPASSQASVSVTPLVNTDLIGAVIGSANFQGGAVDTAALASGAVDAAKLVDGAVTQPKISAGAVGATELAANSVVAGKIAANAVTAGTIAANAVTAGTIAANAVTAGTIEAGAVTATKLSADAIDGKTITGSVIRTTAGAYRVSLGEGGNFLRFYNSAGTLVGSLYPTDGYGIRCDAVTGFEVLQGIKAAAADFGVGTVSGGNIVASTQLSTTNSLGVAFGTGTITRDTGSSPNAFVFSEQLRSAGVYNATTGSAANVFVGSSGNLQRSTSTQRAKTGIVPLRGEFAAAVDRRKVKPETEAASDYRDVLDLVPAEFRSLCENDDAGERFLGFIAEDVHAKFPIAATRDDDGDPDGYDTRAILAALVGVVRDQEEQIRSLTTRLEALEGRLDAKEIA